MKNHRKRSDFSWEVVEDFLKPQKVDLSFKHKLKSIWEENFNPPIALNKGLNPIQAISDKTSIEHFVMQSCRKVWEKFWKGF